MSVVIGAGNSGPWRTVPGRDRTETTAADEIRSGPRHWLASLRHMLAFDFARARQWAPMMVIVQMLMGAGMALMYGFFYPHITQETALFIATGTPTLALIPLGFVMLPGGVGEQRLAGTFGFIWSLPVPRSAQAASTFLLYTVLALPGTVLALVVAWWRYQIHFTITPSVVPAVLLSSLMAVTVGFGMALAIANPMITVADDRVRGLGQRRGRALSTRWLWGPVQRGAGSYLGGVRAAKPVVSAVDAERVSDHRRLSNV